MFVHFAMYNIKHNLPKHHPFLCDFKMQTKMYFMALEIWLWKSFRIVVNGLCTNPVNNTVAKILAKHPGSICRRRQHENESPSNRE